jgi:hypothetical protein
MNMNGKTKPLRKKFSHANLALLLPIGLNFFLINTIWTPTQGWYLEWASYINVGLKPYSDFYLPFPPLFVWVNQIFTFFPDPLIAERIFMTITYSLFSLGLYKLLTRFFTSSISICASMVSILVFQFSPTNTIAGYYEFALLLASWGVYLAMSENTTKKFIGGLLIVGSCLTKQNFLLLVFAIVLMEIFTLRSEKKFQLKNYSTTLGVTCSFVTFAGYLVANDSLLNFIRIMLQGGGKNPEVISLLKNLVVPSARPATLYLFCTILLILTQLKFRKQNQDNTNTIIFYFLVSQMLLILLSPYSLASLIDRRVSIVIFVVIFLATILSREFLDQSGLLRNPRTILSLIFLIPGSVFVLNELYLRIVSFDNSFFHFLADYSSNVGTGLTSLLLIIMNTFIAFQLITIPYPRIKRFFYKCLKDGADHPYLLEKLNYIVIGLLGAGLLNSVNGGFEFPANLILGSISLAFFMKHFEHLLKRNLFILAFSSCLFLSSIQIGIHNYQWFGWNEIASGHLIKERTEENLFRNFLLSGPQKDFYQEIRAGIDLAEEELLKSNISNPKILTFPMQPIVGEMSELSRYRLNCPILHFDICPDNEALVDFERFAKKPPNLVVLFDLGADFIDLNERAWRGGQVSVYRDIQNFFLMSDRYSIVKIVENNSVSLARVYILITTKDGDSRE